MTKRQRKKRLKKTGQYVPNSELWNLDRTICEWIIPRLKKFKEVNCAYPGVEPYDTFEKWQAAIDQMIRSFELAQYDPIDLDENLELVFDYEQVDLEKHKIVYEKWKAEVDKGLKIFAENFNNLWI